MNPLLNRISSIPACVVASHWTFCVAPVTT